MILILSSNPSMLQITQVQENIFLYLTNPLDLIRTKKVFQVNPTIEPAT